jgi:hypothetical protein
MNSNPSKIVAKSFPQFHVGLVTLQFVSNFKYLGHRISANGSDDDDIQTPETPAKNMVLALFGFTLLQYLDVSMYFFFLVVIVCLFLFFSKRFIILQLSCGNYEAVACKISLSYTVIVCHQDLQ